MKPKQSYPLGQRLLLGATLVGALSCSIAAQAQADAAKPGSQESIPVLPLDQSASRGIITRDPSSIVKCKDEYWVFYTGRGVPSYRSGDLVQWERGPAVFKAAPEWIAKIVPENRNLQY
jgi:arabinan endo-1,5-alpha-L-arabinosidase